MNKRRLSYGLLVTFAAAFAVGCGETPPADTPPQATAAPVDTGAPVASATATADATPTPPPTADTPPAPPPKPAKDKFTGKFTQDFSGDVSDAANTVAQKAGGAKKDQKKIDASLDKAKKSFNDNGSTIENTADTLTWSVKGKAVHTMKFEVVKGDDPSALSLRFTKDGKKDLKKPIEVAVTFTDDNTFTVKDPFAKDPTKAQTLVFKRQ